MTRSALVAVALLATLQPAEAAAPNMTEGLWEMVVKSEIPNVSPTSAPALTVQRCMNARDFSDLRKTTPDSKGASHCEVSNYRMQGTTATWDVSCKGAEPMKGSGTMTFEAQRYTGVQKMLAKQNGQNVQITMNYAGRYLGPCRAGQK